MYTALNAAQDIASKLLDDIDTAIHTGGDDPTQHVLNELYGQYNWNEADEASFFETLKAIKAGDATETDIKWMGAITWLGTKAQRKALTK